jgi:hypothetical protein
MIVRDGKYHQQDVMLTSSFLSTRLEFAPSSGPDVTLEELPVPEAMFQLSTDLYIELN